VTIVNICAIIFLWDGSPNETLRGIPLRIGRLDGLLKAVTISPNGEINIMDKIKRMLTAWIILITLFSGACLMVGTVQTEINKNRIEVTNAR